ncbi:MAG: hypothetical protein HZB33_07040 [Nitrospirae bacterium]|nr:hypothetical protein [Nitrospirota bacterium]
MIIEQMGTNQPYLKTNVAVWLRIFLGVNVAVFLSIFIGKHMTAVSIYDWWQQLNKKDGLVAILFPLATIVLNGIIGDTGKARLVFWKWRNPLPGCRAFSVIMNSDPRIDVQRLRSKLIPIPIDPNEQNAVWYRYYKIHASKQTILEAHRVYLLTRDMAALSGIFAIGFSVAVYVSTTGWELSALYSTVLFAQYLVIATSARNYGIRFVANVLTEESHA